MGKKILEEARQLYDDMVMNSYQWTTTELSSGELSFIREGVAQYEVQGLDPCIQNNNNIFFPILKVCSITGRNAINVSINHAN